MSDCSAGQVECLEPRRLLTLTSVDAAQLVVLSDDDGGVIGQKWHDRNGDGVQDADEPGLDGWTIQLLDQNGSVVAATETASIDLNNDGQIDSFTEKGLYGLTAAAGTWGISEVQQPGWRQTTGSGNSESAVLYNLDQQLELWFTGKDFLNWGGQGEKWLQSANGWHYVTPDGSLYEWDAASHVPLSGQLIAQLNPLVHADTQLLHDAMPPDFSSVTLAAGETVTGVNFGNIPTGRIEGRSWHDMDANHRRSPDEPWLNDRLVQLHDGDGNVVASTVTASVDRNHDGQIDAATESGWYVFEGLLPDEYHVHQMPPPQWSVVGVQGQFANEAYALDQQLDFRRPVSSFFNWGGLQETWIWSGRQSWHFMTPDGRLFRWDGSPAQSLSGDLVSQFDPLYWQSPALIYEAANPDLFRVSIAGQTVRNVNIGNIFGMDGSGAGNLIVTLQGNAVSVSGDAQANSLRVYSDSSGRIVLQGAGNTTLNGSPAAMSVPAIETGQQRQLAISLRDGRDQIVLQDLDLQASLYVELGSDNDSFVLADSVVDGNVSVTSPRGDARIRLQDSTLSGNLSVFTSGGDSSLTSVQDVFIGQNATVMNSSGADTVFLQGATVGHATTIITNSGPDSVIVNRSLFFGHVTIRGENGNDLIAVLSTRFNGPVHLYAGNDNDVLGNTSGNRFAFDTGFSGGHGHDTFADDESALSGRTATLSGFEVTDESALADLIDIALGHFDDLLLN